MKRTLVIFLICVFALYIGGMQVTYWFKIDDARGKTFTHIRDARLQKSEIREFTFSKQQYDKLSWNEKNKEFSFNNQDYDVLSICQANNTIKLTCYKDDVETEVTGLFNGIFDKFFSTTQQSKNTENNIAGKICKEYIPQEYITCNGIYEKATLFVFEEKKCHSFSLIESKWHPPTLC